MARDNRDPELLAAAAYSIRRDGEKLSEVFDRIESAPDDVPDWGTSAAVSARVRYNGRLEASNRSFRPTE